MKQKNLNESKKNFFLTAGIIFGTVGILHIYRAFSQWSLYVEDFLIPIWFSAIAGILIVLMSLWAFKLAKKQ